MTNAWTTRSHSKSLRRGCVTKMPVSRPQLRRTPNAIRPVQLASLCAAGERTTLRNPLGNEETLKAPLPLGTSGQDTERQPAATLSRDDSAPALAFEYRVAKRTTGPRRPSCRNGPPAVLTPPVRKAAIHALRSTASIEGQHSPRIEEPNERLSQRDPECASPPPVLSRISSPSGSFLSSLVCSSGLPPNRHQAQRFCKTSRVKSRTRSMHAVFRQKALSCNKRSEAERSIKILCGHLNVEPLVECPEPSEPLCLPDNITISKAQRARLLHTALLEALSRGPHARTH